MGILKTFKDTDLVKWEKSCVMMTLIYFFCSNGREVVISRTV